VAGLFEGFVNGVANRVRRSWRNDPEQAPVEIAKGDVFPRGRPADLFSIHGYDTVSQYLKLDQDLVSRYIDYEEMDDYGEIACLCGTSRVYTVLPEGTGYRTIEELLRWRSENPDQKFYVLAADLRRQRVVPAEAVGPTKTGSRVPVFKVTFEEYRAQPGKEKRRWSIRCTANHLFMLRDGSYKTAGALEPKERLMPLSARVEKNGYLMVTDPWGKGRLRREYLHRRMAEEVLLSGPIPEGFVVHHRDGDKTNPHPGNLSVETRAEHSRIHEITKRPEVRAKIREAAKKRWNNPREKLKWVRAQQRSTSLPDVSCNNPPPTGCLSEAHRQAIAQSHTIPLARDSVEAAVRASSSLSEAARNLNVSWNTLVRRMQQYGLGRYMLGSSLTGPKEGEDDYNNHMVVRVEPDGVEDVYDIEVPVYQNFACEGVFVHNSAIDIYADDVTQPDTQLKRSLWITSPDRTVQEIVDDLYFKTLRYEDEIWSIARTACKYGSNFEEILVTQNGVEGINYLPPATMRRIEGPKGQLLGFIQDFKGRFDFTPEDYRKLLVNRYGQNATSLPGGGQDGFSDTSNLASQDTGPNPVFEDWEIAHFRLHSKFRRSVYGHCLAGGSQVWTTEGPRPISDIQPGQRVLLRHAGKLRTTRVLDHVCSGTKTVYRVRTKHRELCLTAEHPLLAVGKGRGGRNAWKPLCELQEGDRIVITTRMPDTNPPPPLGLHLREIEEEGPVRLTERGASALRAASRIGRYTPKDEGLRPLAAKLGIARGTLESLLKGQSSVPLPVLRDLFCEVKVPFFYGAFEPKIEDERITLPDFVTPDFARLWGFLLGDGWITDGQVYFARGEYPDRNSFYEGLLASTGLPVSTLPDETQSYVSSQALAALFRKLGWVDGGAHAKRLPYWVFGAPEEIRLALLHGFMDADGWDTRSHKDHHIELCNRDLVRDIKTLVDGLGWKSGRIREREPRDNPIATHPTTDVIHSGRQYLLTFNETPIAEGADFAEEKILSIEMQGEEPVYDIEVADPEHNFVADGVVVHNSVLESARWLYKRLILLEDSMLVYRLRRSPERRVFYVDVGDLPPREAMAHVNNVRQQHRKKKFFNAGTGKLDVRYNAFGQDEDFYVPVRKGQEGSRIEVLQGPQWQAIDDVDYFKNKLWASIKIPKAYLGQEEGVVRNILSSQDVRFARTVLRVQRQIINGTHKIGRVHLAALGIDPAQAPFTTHMTVPSAIFELAQVEVMNARADLAGRMREFVSAYWILSTIFGMNDDAIQTIMKQREQEAESQARQEAKAAQIQAQATEPAPEGVPESTRASRGKYVSDRVSGSLPPSKGSGISERQLFAGDREAEKRASEKLDRLLKNDKDLARRLEELRHLTQEISVRRGT
jgi:intein/homing endonuclease